jgi:hypothetical protein
VNPEELNPTLRSAGYSKHTVTQIPVRPVVTQKSKLLVSLAAPKNLDRLIISSEQIHNLKFSNRFLDHWLKDRACHGLIVKSINCRRAVDDTILHMMKKFFSFTYHGMAIAR